MVQSERESSGCFDDEGPIIYEDEEEHRREKKAKKERMTSGALKHIQIRATALYADRATTTKVPSPWSRPNKINTNFIFFL